MSKRLLDCQSSDFSKMSKDELKQAILAAEGRTVCSEMVVFRNPVAEGLTNAEVATSFGADLILLNGFDCYHPEIGGLDKTENPINYLKNLVGRPIGINLEPVDVHANMAEDRLIINEGRICSIETLKLARKLGIDFVCLTGNPGTGVTNKEIIKAIHLAKEHFGGLIIAGKMHGAGVNEPVSDLDTVNQFVEAGADIILVPAVGTVPGLTDEEVRNIVLTAHKEGALVMSAIGTSQESSDKETINQLAIRNKIIGVDIQHIGDAGYAGLAPVENIFALSVAIRGMRHTISMVARSVNR